MKTFRTKGDVKDWARQVEDQMVRGAYIDRVGAERLSLEKALERYLREVTPTKRPTTARREHLAADVLTDRLGEYSLAALSPDLVANYRDERLSEGKSPDTVRIELALLSHLYTIAIREWHLGLLYSPVANIRKPTPGRGRNRRLTPDEERRLLKACRALPNPTLDWLVRTALHTTMRAGELLTLQMDQVDLPRRIVRLEQTKNGSARTVPLSRAAVATLREALKYPARPEETSLVFPGEPGKDGQRRPYQFHCVWSRMLKRAGITGLRFHDLRHTSRVSARVVRRPPTAPACTPASLQWRVRAQRQAPTLLVERASAPAPADAEGVRSAAPMSWMQRLHRVFGIEIERCPKCAAKLRVICVVDDPALIGRILEHLDARDHTPRAPPSVHAAC